MREIKVMADYPCHPLWDTSSGSYGDIDPASLPISDELKQGLVRWASDYEKTLNMDDPAKSGFKDEEEAAFKAQGVRLAEQLQRELGPDIVVSIQI